MTIGDAILRSAIVVAIAALLVIGIKSCDGKDFVVQREPDYQLAPMTYTCTVPQMEKAQKESAWCKENTSFFSSVCYGSAIMRNCTKRENGDAD